MSAAQSTFACYLAYGSSSKTPYITHRMISKPSFSTLSSIKHSLYQSFPLNEFEQSAAAHINIRYRRTHVTTNSGRYSKVKEHCSRGSKAEVHYPEQLDLVRQMAKSKPARLRQTGRVFVRWTAQGSGRNFRGHAAILWGNQASLPGDSQGGRHLAANKA